MATDHSKDLVRWTGISEDENAIEAAAKMLEWFLDTNWHETWTSKDSDVLYGYVKKVIVGLREVNGE